MYKLDRIEYTDIFYFTKDSVKAFGTTLIQGSFNEVLAIATTLKNNANDIGTGGSIRVTNANNLTNITNAKWYVIFLDSNLSNLNIQIVRTSGAEKYSLPTNFETYQETLQDIFTRISNLVNN
jgi:shikimate kinase